MTEENTISKKIVLNRKNLTAAAVLIPIFTAVALVALVLKTELIDKFDNIGYLKNIYHYIIAAGIFVLSYTILYFYMFVQYREGLQSTRVFAAAGTAITLNLLFCMGMSYLSPYAMPLCFAPIIVSTLIERKVSHAVALVCILQALTFVLSGIGMTGDAAPLFPLFIVSCGSVCFNFISAGRINQNTGRARFIVYLLVFSVIYLPATFLPALLYGNSAAEFGTMAQYISIGAAAQVFLVLFFAPVLERAFMITTSARLAEVCDLRQPLLKRLMKEAPATFNHSQTVGNLAESCATALGLNPYMARAAALYHDIGKLCNIEYFNENQSGVNPHDQITPELSVDIIRKHAYDGFRMATEARLPKEVAAITQEHHGTTLIKYFYDKAQRMTDGEVDKKAYRHTCSTPTTKIAAVIMVCDSSEAAIRAMAAPDKEKVSKLVGGIIDDRLLDGQFDNCEITTKDLAVIRQTIAELSTGLYHTRIEYPKEK